MFVKFLLALFSFQKGKIKPTDINELLESNMEDLKGFDLRYENRTEYDLSIITKNFKIYELLKKLESKNINNQSFCINKYYIWRIIR